MKNDIEKVLLSEKEIADIIANLGQQISKDYKDKNLLMVSILKGSVVFMADLMRAIDIHCRIDFMCVSSYGSSTLSSGSVKICTFLDKPARREADIKADYVGAVVPDEFVVGYGLDYDEKYRNLPYLGVLKPAVYEK